MILSAAEYRDRADKCEHQAARTNDPDVKAHYLDLAKSWRLLAEQADLVELEKKKSAF
jgi:hypothetical protein